MVVNAGSYNDPKDIPGLAHFIEHSKWYDRFIVNILIYFIFTKIFSSLWQY